MENSILRYPCLVLDHDDTVVASESSVNYPCFLLSLKRFRPGSYMNHETFSRWCFDPGFAELLQRIYHFSDKELDEEFLLWKQYASTHIPPAYPGMREIIRRQQKMGGKVCVVSHSSRSSILRDYQVHFDTEPDMIFSWEDPAPHRKPNAYPLKKIMEVYGFKPSELLVVDDLKPGCDMAKKADVQIAYAGWGRKNVPEISRIMETWCDYAFDTTEDFSQFLFGVPV